MSRDELDEPRVILVGIDDHSGLRDTVGRILSRGRVSLASVLDVAPEVDEIVRRAGEAPMVALRCDLDPAPSNEPWVAPKSRTVYPTPRRSSWRKKTRRANSHGQRRS